MRLEKEHCKANPQIAQIITLSELGGAQKVVYQIVSSLKEKADFTVICHPGGELVDWLKKENIRVITLKSLKREIRPLSDLLTFIFLFFWLLKERPDIVHCHSSKAGILGRIAAKMAGVKKIIFTVHGWGFNDFQPRMFRSLLVWSEQLAGRFTDEVICVSEHDKEIGLKYNIAKPSQLKVIHNGIDDASLENASGLLKKELALPAEAFIIGSVGRLAEQKDPLAFIKVAESMLKKCKKDNLYFVWLGDGPLMIECHKIINQKRLQDRILFPGPKENAAALISDFDIFVLLSKWEGLPLVLIEAMFQGKPLVAYDVGGVSELIQPGENGFLVPYGKQDYVEAVLVYMMNSIELLALMDNGSKKLAKSFSIAKTIGLYGELYGLPLEILQN